MRTLWRGFSTAFSLYSTIPVPRVAWEKESIQYALCFFPLVGAVIGLLELLWYGAAQHLGLVSGLYSAVATLLPILISGGIHLDGWVDTVDALSAHTNLDRRHEILKDPHVGAFGVMGCGCYLLLQWGLWTQLYQAPKLLVLAACGFVLSRCLNALSIATFAPAKESGLVYTFQDGAVKPVVVVVCGILFLGALWPSMYVSAAWTMGMAAAILGYFMVHRYFCREQFGGNSGDLAGFFLQNAELLSLTTACVGGIVG